MINALCDFCEKRNAVTFWTNIKYCDPCGKLLNDVCVDLKKLKEENSKLKEENEKLRSVVEFYGDESIYSNWGYMRVNGDDYYDCDKEYLGNNGAKDMFKLTGGKKARACLKEFEK